MRTPYLVYNTQEVSQAGYLKKILPLLDLPLKPLYRLQLAYVVHPSKDCILLIINKAYEDRYHAKYYLSN